MVSSTTGAPLTSLPASPSRAPVQALNSSSELFPHLHKSLFKCKQTKHKALLQLPATCRIKSPPSDLTSWALFLANTGQQSGLASCSATEVPSGILLPPEWPLELSPLVQDPPPLPSENPSSTQPVAGHSSGHKAAGLDQEQQQHLGTG